jgi:shikimate kinase
LKKNNFPIIHIIGLPGAGKTTLGKRLSEELNLPVYQIGKYRARFPLSDIGEADAWVTLFRDLSKRKWRNCILETTGLNSRESFLGIALPPQRIVTIKLEAPRNVLYERIKKKRRLSTEGENGYSVEITRVNLNSLKSYFESLKEYRQRLRLIQANSDLMKYIKLR